MIPKSLLSFLDKNKVKYEIVKHKIVYTAHDKAATLKLKPESVAKTIVASLDGKDHAIAIVPANKNLDKKKLLQIINKVRQKSGVKAAKKIDFAKEVWMKKNIKGVKVGSTPPFGILYKIPTFIDNILAKQTKIIVNAGDYQNSLKITPSLLFKIDDAAKKGSFSQKK